MFGKYPTWIVVGEPEAITLGAFAAFEWDVVDCGAQATNISKNAGSQE